MKYLPKDHTFVICAYKESPFLEICIRSLKRQTLATNVIMASSTDTDLIRSLSDKYAIPLYINPKGPSGIAGDWNYALSRVSTPLATIAHQDDIYKEDYAKVLLRQMSRAASPLIAFTDYSEIREGEEVCSNRLLDTKRMMLRPLKRRGRWESKWTRRRILSLGSAICCPSVTYNLDALSLPIFHAGYLSDLDWEAWEKISKMDGDFVYCPQILMSHRIHEDSATTQIIANSERTREDYDMFCRFWPKGIAAILEHYYRSSEKQNDLKK